MEKLVRYRWIVFASAIAVFIVVVLISYSRIGCRIVQSGNICGHVMSQSDVSTLPHSPLRDTLVLAIPSDQFETLLDEAEVMRRGKPEDVRFTIDEELFAQYVEDAAISRLTGVYTLEVPPGKYLLCLANIGLPKPPQILPTLVVGCTEVVVPKDRRVNKDFFWGRGGINFP